MSEIFTASNGIKVSLDVLGGINYDESSLFLTLPGMRTTALREFFQNERDQELGRWRWPENPDYVIIPRARGVRVVSETTGMSLDARRGQYRGGGATLFGAAAAYFDAHPERKPWEDAKPGEVWLLTLDGDESAFYPSKSLSRAFTPVAPNTGMTAVSMNWPEITAGRCIWPESS